MNLRMLAVALLCLLAQATLAQTTHKENTKAGTAYVYDAGKNKGYLCGLVQQNGTAFDVFLPALWPAPIGEPLQMLSVPWLHYANQRDAQDAIDAYCPTKNAPAAVLS
jgi:hypothetical protein